MLHEYFCAPNGDGALVVRNEDEGAYSQGWMRWSACYIVKPTASAGKRAGLMHRATTYCATKHPNDGGAAEEHEDGGGCDCGGAHPEGEAHEVEGGRSCGWDRRTCPLCSCRTGEKMDWRTLRVKSDEMHAANFFLRWRRHRRMQGEQRVQRQRRQQKVVCRRAVRDFGT
jgi:hypothetical protein